MTYTLYNRYGSGGFAVEAALTLAGAPFHLEALDSQPSTVLPESFRSINPWNQVPTLILPDGTMMTETGAILIHIADAFPGDGVGPDRGTSEHAVFLRWTVFMSVNIYEGVLRLVYPDRYTTEKDGEAGVVKAARQRNHEAFLVMEREVQSGNFLCGAKMSGADIYLAMLCAWHDRHDAMDDLAGCRALTHRVAGHPVVAPVWQRNFDHRLKTKWGRSPEPAAT